MKKEKKPVACVTAHTLSSAQPAASVRVDMIQAGDSGGIVEPNGPGMITNGLTQVDLGFTVGSDPHCNDSGQGLNLRDVEPATNLLV